MERRRTRRHRLPRSALKQLQVKKYAKTDPWETCAICLDDYEEGAKLRILPCQHGQYCVFFISNVKDQISFV